MASPKTRKKLKGEIVSDRANKTVVVLVNRYIKHKRYGKYIRIGKKYKAHDENNEYKIGDKVVIEECPPISKDKHFKVIAKVSEATSSVTEEATKV